ncbi:hypothetical protein CPC08DRAFT_527155 [Agrocybe pediades]|nr:hypothetical protein CPC08DRAFT_527155 [Agrocybe pediades]
MCPCPSSSFHLDPRFHRLLPLSDRHQPTHQPPACHQSRLPPVTEQQRDKTQQCQQQRDITTREEQREKDNARRTKTEEELCTALWRTRKTTTRELWERELWRGFGEYILFTDSDMR